MPNANVIYKAHKGGAWYTPLHVLDVAREVLDGWDLDPCTHPSNPTGARLLHYSVRDSAWKHDWAAELALACKLRKQTTATIWQNQPFGRGIGRDRCGCPGRWSEIRGE